MDNGQPKNSQPNGQAIAQCVLLPSKSFRQDIFNDYRKSVVCAWKSITLLLILLATNRLHAEKESAILVGFKKVLPYLLSRMFFGIFVRNSAKPNPTKGKVQTSICIAESRLLLVAE